MHDRVNPSVLFACGIHGYLGLDTATLCLCISPYIQLIDAGLWQLQSACHVTRNKHLRGLTDHVSLVAIAR